LEQLVERIPMEAKSVMTRSKTNCSNFTINAWKPLIEELVFGEDDPVRAAPPKLIELYSAVRRNYFRGSISTI
jgi:hypothetical protein